MFLTEIECRIPIHSFFIKNILYDKMDLRLFYFHVTSFEMMRRGKYTPLQAMI